MFTPKKQKREKRREIRDRAIFNGLCRRTRGDTLNGHYVITRQRRQRQGVYNIQIPATSLPITYLPHGYGGHVQERVKQRKPYNSYKRCEHDNKHTHEEDDTVRLVRTAHANNNKQWNHNLKKTYVRMPYVERILSSSYYINISNTFINITSTAKRA